MKKIFYSIIIIIIAGSFLITSCGSGQQDVTLPNCDNTLTQTQYGLNFDWSQCTYGIPSNNNSFGCTQSPYNNSSASVPGAGGAVDSYLNSDNGFNAQIGSYNPTILANQFLFQITVSNDAAANSSCNNTTQSTNYYFHLGTSYNLQIQLFQNAATDITADYYEPCEPCSSNNPNGRPYYSGVQMVYQGDDPAIEQMMNSKLYTDQNCQ